ncbi:MAG: hypothetical protein ACI4J5_06725 [Oscillospiraceae bacterium]
MFEYLPEEGNEACEYKEKKDKKPLLVKLAVFRLAAAIAILAAMLLFRAVCPQGSEKLSEEFRSSAGDASQADELISEAAQWFMGFIERLPSDRGD